MESCEKEKLLDIDMISDSNGNKVRLKMAEMIDKDRA